MNRVYTRNLLSRYAALLLSVLLLPLSVNAQRNGSGGTYYDNNDDYYDDGGYYDDGYQGYDDGYYEDPGYYESEGYYDNSGNFYERSNNNGYWDQSGYYHAVSSRNMARHRPRSMQRGHYHGQARHDRRCNRNHCVSSCFYKKIVRQKNYRRNSYGNVRRVYRTPPPRYYRGRRAAVGASVRIGPVRLNIRRY